MTMNFMFFFLILHQKGSDEGDEGEADTDGGGQGGGSGAPTLPGHPGKSRQSIRLRRKRHRALANKPQDFQVLFDLQLFLIYA